MRGNEGETVLKKEALTLTEKNGRKGRHGSQVKLKRIAKMR